MVLIHFYGLGVRPSTDHGTGRRHVIWSCFSEVVFALVLPTRTCEWSLTGSKGNGSTSTFPIEKRQESKHARSPSPLGNTRHNLAWQARAHNGFIMDSTLHELDPHTNAALPHNGIKSHWNWLNHTGLMFTYASECQSVNPDD